MLEAIQRFVGRLRSSGVRVSPAEAIDAARAIGAIDVERRDRFRAALRSTLSKTREDAATFDRIFERFFSAPSGRGEKRSPGSRGERTPPGAGKPPRPVESDGGGHSKGPPAM